ncbi:MAG: hypothetical protein JRF02_08465 [Deltaproteobacteria bacterium]|jgi:hypothetical protein|nr:hypothetical protein [Deltaproteobacteria bacterium]
MPRIIFSNFILIMLWGIFYLNPVMAESSEKYAAMAQSTWSAFECSVLAEKIKNVEEQERLFRFGYEKGLNYITALQSGKIAKEDLSNEVPPIMLLLQGPTPDFMLGRIFENAVESALENIPQRGEHPGSDELQKIIAGIEYRKRKCQLIGKQ